MPRCDAHHTPTHTSPTLNEHTWLCSSCGFHITTAHGPRRSRRSDGALPATPVHWLRRPASCRHARHSLHAGPALLESMSWRRLALAGWQSSASEAMDSLLLLMPTALPWLLGPYQSLYHLEHHRRAHHPQILDSPISISSFHSPSRSLVTCSPTPSIVCTPSAALSTSTPHRLSMCVSKLWPEPSASAPLSIEEVLEPQSTTKVPRNPSAAWIHGALAVAAAVPSVYLFQHIRLHLLNVVIPLSGRNRAPLLTLLTA